MIKCHKRLEEVNVHVIHLQLAYQISGLPVTFSLTRSKYIYNEKFLNTELRPFFEFNSPFSLT